MNLDLYDQFIRLNNSGRRNEAKAALDLFIASAESPANVQKWVFPFLENGGYGHKSRHEIYEKLVYPVLLEGYLKHDAKSILWLQGHLRTSQR